MPVLHRNCTYGQDPEPPAASLSLMSSGVWELVLGAVRVGLRSLTCFGPKGRWGMGRSQANVVYPWTMCGVSSHSCVPGEWRSQVSDLHMCQKTRSGNSSMILNRQSFRPAHQPSKRLGLRRPGWKTHVLSGTGTMDCSRKGVWDCKEGGLLKEHVTGEK